MDTERYGIVPPYLRCVQYAGRYQYENIRFTFTFTIAAIGKLPDLILIM